VTLPGSPVADMEIPRLAVGPHLHLVLAYTRRAKRREAGRPLRPFRAAGGLTMFPDKPVNSRYRM